MSKRLQRAIAKLERLPKGLQEEAATFLLAYVDETPTTSERISIDEAREAYANGDFATLATWKLELGL
ncbi:hypothetical protein UNPF46_30760 [Bradyrhizobium sp. UNPF46]|nr:hypothetical protein UNPF46_30760 [Bradyrhizobium sp. UNPF46]